MLIQLVPVRRAADVLAAFPNGYFKPDLSPMQNHVLARTLEERHGLALFGIGASTLASGAIRRLTQGRGARRWRR